MKIFLLTPIYSQTTGGAAATPVVHYFAKEWVKQGHDVTVFHLDATFPSILYQISKRFQHGLVSALNYSVPIEKPQNYHRTIEGVDVYGVTYTKYIPHSRIGEKQKRRIVDLISGVITEKGIPDIFIGHWELPQLDILPLLKQKYNKPTCLVLHSNDFLLEKKFGEDLYRLFNQIDIIGFRNKTALENFKDKYAITQKTFVAHSGVSEDFINQGSSFTVDFSKGVSKFIYVGLLIERKHPLEVIKSLDSVYKKEPYELTFVGDGTLKDEILHFNSIHPSPRRLTLPGRLKRGDVIDHLKKCQVFVMISEQEIFGLVYLEAMALGLIPIGSRGEGIDGIIEDGVNGFLCKPGDADDLSAIIKKIKGLSESELLQISQNARKTAIAYSDYNVAKKYIDNLIDDIV